MSNTVTVNIKGLDELQKKLEELPKLVAAKVLKDSLLAAGNVIRDEMAARAPKDSGLLSEHFNVKLKVEKQGIAATAFVGPDGTIDYPKHEGKEK
jgi:HK97 gp10 family phage protein